MPSWTLPGLTSSCKHLAWERRSSWRLAAGCFPLRQHSGPSLVRRARSRGASPELVFQSRRTGTETAEAEAALAGGGCEIGIWVVRSGFADPPCLAAAAGAWVCRCQEEPCSGACGCCKLPWADILPSAAGSVPKALEQCQPLERCSCRLAPGSDRAQVTLAIPTQGPQDLPVAAHQLVKVFFPSMLFGVNAFLLSSAFYPFAPAFPAPKRTASLPCTVAVPSIMDHHGTSKSSPSSVSSASPILRKPNLEAHEGTYGLQTIIPFCGSLHQPRLTCETKVSGG